MNVEEITALPELHALRLVEVTVECGRYELNDTSVCSIVNVRVSDLHEWFKLGPLRVRKIAPRAAILHDDRVPDYVHQNHWCECCCPEALLPLPQRLRVSRAWASGRRKKTDDGIVIEIYGETT